ncbi:MAG: phosphoribosyltransferase family protein [Desulfuromonadales bacterium]|jgi:putative phosphoribosyl transferase
MTSGNIHDLEKLRERTGVFADRRDAGRILAALVAQEMLPEPLILAIPAGGVPVAAVLAEALGAPLDVAVVSKITLPWNSEAGYGAVAFDGSYQLNEALIRSAGLSPQGVTQGIETTRRKVANRVASFRAGHALPDLAVHDLVVVDDGLASGFTMLVAIAALQRAGARSITVAVPTGHLKAVQRIAQEVATVCCANLRSGTPYAVAAAYRHWTDVSEAEALLVLAESAETRLS